MSNGRHEIWIEPIRRMGACDDALVWLEDYASLADAWEKCDRGDWMLWLLRQLSDVNLVGLEGITLSMVRAAYATAYDAFAHVDQYNAAAYAVAYAVAYAKRMEILKQYADIVRLNYPHAPKVIEKKG